MNNMDTRGAPYGIGPAKQRAAYGWNFKASARRIGSSFDLASPLAPYEVCKVSAMVTCPLPTIPA